MLEEPVIPMPKDHPSHGVVGEAPPGGMNHEAGQSQVPTQAKKPATHKDEKIALVLFLTGGFTIWNIF